MEPEGHNFGCWIEVENNVLSRLCDNSHGISKIRKQTQITNYILKEVTPVKSYSQYVNLRKAVTNQVHEDVDTDDNSFHDSSDSPDDDDPIFNEIDEILTGRTKKIKKTIRSYIKHNYEIQNMEIDKNEGSNYNNPVVCNESPQKFVYYFNELLQPKNDELIIDEQNEDYCTNNTANQSSHWEGNEISNVNTSHEEAGSFSEARPMMLFTPAQLTQCLQINKNCNENSPGKIRPTNDLSNENQLKTPERNVNDHEIKVETELTISTEDNKVQDYKNILENSKDDLHKKSESSINSEIIPKKECLSPTINSPSKITNENMVDPLADSDICYFECNNSKHNGSTDNNSKNEKNSIYTTENNDKVNNVIQEIYLKDENFIVKNKKTKNGTFFTSPGNKTVIKSNNDIMTIINNEHTQTVNKVKEIYSPKITENSFNEDDEIPSSQTFDPNLIKFKSVVNRKRKYKSTSPKEKMSNNKNDEVAGIDSLNKSNSSSKAQFSPMKSCKSKFEKSPLSILPIHKVKIKNFNADDKQDTEFVPENNDKSKNKWSVSNLEKVENNYEQEEMNKIGVKKKKMKKNKKFKAEIDEENSFTKVKTKNSNVKAVLNKDKDEEQSWSTSKVTSTPPILKSGKKKIKSKKVVNYPTKIQPSILKKSTIDDAKTPNILNQNNTRQESNFTKSPNVLSQKELNMLNKKKRSLEASEISFSESEFMSSTKYEHNTPKRSPGNVNQKSPLSKHFLIKHEKTSFKHRRNKILLSTKRKLSAENKSQNVSPDIKKRKLKVG